MNMVFFYMCDGPAPSGSNPTFHPNKKTQNKFALNIRDEGYYYMLVHMLKRKIIDKLTIVIESNHTPGQFVTRENIQGWVVPTIDQVRPMLSPEPSIFWVRGGFRTWHDFLVSMKRKHWLVLYAANTGRGRWPFWDVVLNDYYRKIWMDKGNRLIYPFLKPTNPDIFKPMKIPRDFDICIGASNVHDKKGQWKVIHALIQYKKKTGKNLKCVMPGAARRSVKSNEIPYLVATHGLDVTITGGVPRKKLCELYNRSKVFIHAGGCGENDRGPIEALRCGCFLIIGNHNYHAPFVYEGPAVVLDVDNTDEFVGNLIKMFEEVPDLDGLEKLREEITNYHTGMAGKETCVANMEAMVEILKSNDVEKGIRWNNL